MSLGSSVNISNTFSEYLKVYHLFINFSPMIHHAVKAHTCEIREAQNPPYEGLGSQAI